MVITRTPLRVSFVGGGSDITSFANEHGGAVVSTTIDKYVYVIVTERFEDNVRVSYSETEIVPKATELRHEIVREALRVAGLPRKVEIVTIADVPAKGTGLGSSSAVAVGTLSALFAYQGILKSSKELAEDASTIEIDVLGKPIGRQDQYAVALGGLSLYEFGPGERVERRPVVLTSDSRDEIERSLLMFYLGTQRAAESVLAGVSAAAGSNGRTTHLLGELRDLALDLYDELGKGDPGVLAEYLDRGWQLKRELVGVTNNDVDRWYEQARRAGATGGKLLGAGGGGFLLLYVPPERQAAVRAELDELRELPMSLDDGGSRLIFIGS
jgi:D-glycero-alpha-D-manno-heptose-7-phosphate kinase